MSSILVSSIDLIKFQVAQNSLNEMGFEVEINGYGACFMLNGEKLKLWFTSVDQLEGFAAGVRHERESKK